MFKTFLNKEDRHSLDLSAFINYSPEQLMFYYHNSWINISLDTYLQMKEWFENGYGNQFNLKLWLDLIEQHLQAQSDLQNLHESEYLNSIGPYYYVPTSTQIYFVKLYAIEHEPLTSADFAILFGFHKIPAVDRIMQKYARNRKGAKKAARNKDELIRDIASCAASLEHIEKISQHSRYLNILLEERKANIVAADTLPLEPAPLPEKPPKPEEPPLTLNRLLAIGKSRGGQNDYDRTCADYNRNIKIYFIRYREYEKACDRYKEALQDWEEYREAFVKQCRSDIQRTLAQLEETKVLMETYHYVIRKSYIHPDYQDRVTLDTFKRYLETGRADDLQGCMNLYEEERLWTDIKASQERIENTIHHLQSENEALYLASDETARLIASAHE